MMTCLALSYMSVNKQHKVWQAGSQRVHRTRLVSDMTQGFRAEYHGPLEIAVRCTTAIPTLHTSTVLPVAGRPGPNPSQNCTAP
jgi:hypothetical protein